MSTPSAPPPGWSLRPLDELVQSVRATARIEPTATYELWSIPSFATGSPEIVSGASIGSGKLAVAPGDVLISKINPRINRVWAVKPRSDAMGQISSTEWLVARIRHPKTVDGSFLRLYATSPAFRSLIEEGTQGVTGSHTRAKADRVLKIPVPLPPLDEQEQIVAVLEEQLSRLDAALASIQTVRTKADQFRRSLLHAAFAGHLVETRPAAEHSWETCLLGDVAAVQSGIQKQPKRRPDRNRYPFLRVANVGRGSLDLDDVHEVELFGDEIDRYRLEPGDLLVVEGNGSRSQIGRSAVWGGEINDCVHQNHLIRVRPMDRILPRYLEYFWNSPVTSEAVASLASSTSGLHTLSTSKLKSVPVLVPGLEDQKRIVEVLDAELSRLGGMLEAADRAESRCGALRRSLLHSAFTGKLTEEWRNSHG